MLLVTSEGSSSASVLHKESTVTLVAVRVALFFKISTKHLRLEGMSLVLQVFGSEVITQVIRIHYMGNVNVCVPNFMAIDPIVEVCQSGSKW